VYEFKPNFRDHLECAKEPGLFYKVMNKISGDRKPGPKGIHQVSWSTRRRWMEDWKKLAGASGEYRPGTLKGVTEALKALNPADYGIGIYDSPPWEHEKYEVQPRDNLQKIATKYYGDPLQWETIHKANLDVIDDPGLIYPGQPLRIPKPFARPAENPVV
jgi:hypothetical protein